MHYFSALFLPVNISEELSSEAATGGSGLSLRYRKSQPNPRGCAATVLRCHEGTWAVGYTTDKARLGALLPPRDLKGRKDRPGHRSHSGPRPRHQREENSAQSKGQPRQLLEAPPAAAEPRSGLRKGGVWRGSYATSPAASHKSRRPHPRARARFSRRPFVSATAGQSPPRSAARPSERQASHAPRFLAADSTPRSSRPPRTLTLLRALSTASPIPSCQRRNSPPFWCSEWLGRRSEKRGICNESSTTEIKMRLL